MAPGPPANRPIVDNRCGFGPAMAEQVRLQLPLRRESARRARLAVEPLRSSIPELVLVVSELVSDAVLTRMDGGGDTLGLGVSADGKRLRIEVTAASGSLKAAPSAPAPGEQGWGIYLLKRLGYRWTLENRGEVADLRASKDLRDG